LNASFLNASFLNASFELSHLLIGGLNASFELVHHPTAQRQYAIDAPRGEAPY
jgi:hypothetical protein